MNNIEIKDLITYILVAGAVFVGLYILFLVIRNACKAAPPKYEDVKGKIKIEGETEYNDVNIIIGIMKDKSKLAVAVIKNKSGNPCKTLTDAKGNYFIKDVPEGSFWLVASKKGCKTTMKLVKIKSGKLNKLPEISLK